MVDAATCYKEKNAIFGDLNMRLFTEPNTVLHEPIRDLLDEFDTNFFQKRKTRGDVPVPDVGKWIDECDEKSRAQVSCIS